MTADYGKNSGLYIVAESIDCGGKGTVIDCLKEYEREEGKVILDLRDLWQSKDVETNQLIQLYGTEDVIPEYDKIKYLYEKNQKRLSAIVACEPTWANIGLKIRKKIIHEVKGLSYTAKDTADAYAEDRKELITKLIRPALMDGVDVLSERNFCTSVVYQSSMDNPLTIEEILAIEGNSIAANNSPHLYIICDVSAETGMERKNSRKKQDNCRFEVPEFQKKVESKYTSTLLKSILNDLGSKVVYLFTDKPSTKEETIASSLDILRKLRLDLLNDGEKFNYRK